MTLKEFFVDKIITIPFKLLGKTHIFLIFIVIISLLIIYLNKNKLYNIKPRTKRIITKSLAIILLLNMIILYISSFYFHNFNYKTMLPLHLCYLANYLYIYLILFNKEKYYKYLYILGFLGPIPAIIFFDVRSVFESFNFYLYIISHHIFLIGTFLTFYLYPTKIKLKDLLKLGIILNILYFLIGIFNKIYHTNYFFSDSIPAFIKNSLPFLKHIPNIITLELVAILIMSLLYIFWNHEIKKIKYTSK